MVYDILKIVLGIVIGFVIGFFVARYIIKRELKKNPPINEDVIKMLMQQMGRTPTQKQVNQVMKQMQKMM